MKQFNVDLDHIRLMWGIPKGVTLLIWESSCRWIGNPHACSAHYAVPMNDNEARK